MTDRATAWAVIKPKTALRRLGNGGGAVPIKSQASPVPKSGYVAAFSASGQDVWLPHATHLGDALILSAVGARCGKVFRAKGQWALVANTTPLGVGASHSPDFWFYRCNTEGWWIREGSAQPFVRVRPTLDRAEPTPSLEEQGLIVRYLDHAELRIAKAIATKQGLMNRLLELRHVQIAEGILGTDGTRLLNSSLPYNVPGSWRVEPFWSVAPEMSISDQQGKELLSVYLNRGVIRYSESAGQVHKPSLDLSGYQLVRPGDLVLNNQQAWRGSVGVSRYEGIVSPAYVVCSLGDRFDLEYANMLFRSPAMVSQFEMASRGVGSIQRQLHRQTLRVTKVPIPPMEEQVQIAKRLVAATKGLDLAIQSLETEIVLLKEYRTRLISDAVTGKLDVREEAAKLPEIDPMELATVSASENGDDEEATDDD